MELRGNNAGAGGAGGDAFYRTDGGNGGNGGGLFNSGMLTMHKFLIEENAAGDPGSKMGTGHGGYDHPGSPGSGAGIFNRNDLILLDGSDPQ